MTRATEQERAERGGAGGLRPGGGAALAPTAPAAEVVLPWLVRLRWVAVAGQAATIHLVWWLLAVDLPLAPLAGTVAATAGTNVLLAAWLARGRSVSWWAVPAVLSLDTLLFTNLLYFSGGPTNPFSLLYVVHVAMAAVTLSWRWTWFMAVLSAVCFGLLFVRHVPLELSAGFVDYSLHVTGTWFAVTLVAVVIAYFIGRVNQALRLREEQLARVRGLAARNERLASLTTLAAGAAHELGTPLGTIAVVARELERAADQRTSWEGVQEDAQLIRSQVDRCRAILDRMSAQAQEELDSSPDPVPLEELRADLEDDVGLPRGSLRLAAPEGLTEVTGPRTDVVQALAPLVKNALDATGGQETVTLGVERADGRLRFTVRDRGEGMGPGVLARASEPFFTTKPPGSGTGLGLYLVRLLSERLGGSFQLDSRPGEGTTAVLELPEVEAAR